MPKTIKSNSNSFCLFIRDYLIYLAPIIYLILLAIESYQMDFRAFYVAGRSVLLGLDPYLNPVGIYPELFGAGNADYRITSGFIYPPLAALAFIFIGWIPSYETARIIFSLLMIFVTLGVFYIVTSQLSSKPSGLPFLFCLVSIPTMALFERGQIDFLMVLMSLIALYLYEKSSNHWGSALTLALAAHIKVFPIFLLVYFLVVKKDIRFCVNTVLITIGIFAGSYLYFGSDVNMHFFQRSLPSIFGEIIGEAPLIVEPKQEIVYFYIVSAIQGNLKILSHDFVNGPMNPIFFDSSVSALLFGSILEITFLLVSKTRSDGSRFYAAMNILNIINPKSWIMGIVWYLPLFVCLFDRANSREKIVLLTPLFLPAFLSLNGYASVVITFSFAFGWLCPQIENKSYETLNADNIGL